MIYDKYEVINGEVFHNEFCVQIGAEIPAGDYSHAFLDSLETGKRFIVYDNDDETGEPHYIRQIEKDGVYWLGQSTCHYECAINEEKDLVMRYARAAGLKSFQIRWLNEGEPLEIVQDEWSNRDNPHHKIYGGLEATDGEVIPGRSSTDEHGAVSHPVVITNATWVILYARGPKGEAHSLYLQKGKVDAVVFGDAIARAVFAPTADHKVLDMTIEVSGKKPVQPVLAPANKW